MKNILLLSATVAVLAFAEPAFAAKKAKVELCHYNGHGSFRVLTLPSKAANSHIRSHGDFLPTTFYEDADGDGYGNADVYFTSCEETEAGFVVNGDDLDDTNPYFSLERDYEEVGVDSIEGEGEDDEFEEY
ncbi:hypothetical protein GCM10009069_27630 [Algimonas arctica]|uniref:Uncharacterized protein n=1 Tax=Algimonas arctica TaxID=1479486 RepID=A0A8J3CUL7_9PROT|nr:hypothetical protein [Algimonas arctica]GHB03413.1 hypothetical protein GCM10009069_27630 [Algimonas arctica]